MKEQVKNRVAFFVYWQPIEKSPTLISSIKLLAKNGFTVDVFVERTYFEPKFRIDSEVVNIFFLDQLATVHTEVVLNDLEFLAREGDSIGLDGSHFLKQLVRNDFGFLESIAKINKIVGDRGYVCFFGVEQKGLIAATVLSLKNKAPVFYHNLELKSFREGKSEYTRYLNSLEKLFNNLAELVIIQDMERAKVWIDYTKMDESKICILPVGALGPAYRKKTDYLRKKFNIPEDKKIILYAGEVTRELMWKEVAIAAQRWPMDWALVMHCNTGYHMDYFEELRQLALDGKVIVYFDFVPYDELNKLIASADIGLVFYDGVDENFLLTGSASGKLAHYLRCGLPVITSDSPSLRRAVQTYKCGESTNDMGELEKLIKKIFANYQEYRENAFSCFEQKYEHARYFQRVIDKIRS